MIKRLLWLGCFVVISITSAAFAGPIESVYTYLGQDDCRQWEGSVDPDWVLDVCEGPAGNWAFLLYQDSARLSVGFGEVPHRSGWWYDLERGDWPIEWRGIREGSQFQPLAVIARFKTPDANESSGAFLSVLGLLPDGTSCQLSTVPAGGDENLRARQVPDEYISGRLGCSADGALERFTPEEPFPISMR